MTDNRTDETDDGPPLQRYRYTIEVLQDAETGPDADDIGFWVYDHPGVSALMGVRGVEVAEPGEPRAPIGVLEALRVAMAAMDDRASLIEEDMANHDAEEANALTAAYLVLKQASEQGIVWHPNMAADGTYNGTEDECMADLDD